MKKDCENWWVRD